MGITERKEREREEMRRLILEAAQRLFIAHGFDKVSIRTIADEIEYSPATIYLYYKDKNDLLFALHQAGFRAMIEQMQPALASVDDPFERLIAMGTEYIRFAVSNPELFDLMFIMTAPIEALTCRDETWDDGLRAFQLLVDLVQSCIDAGLFKTQDATTAALMIWSAVHGYTALFLRKRLTMFDEANLQQQMNQAFVLFIETIRRGL
ncbi:hypothetical protein GCM10027578_10630 [Spirosoma luteolum]